MIVLLVFAFISGLVTIAAPCIWPLLPIILSTTTTGGHRKPLGVTLGIILSFGFLTLALSYIVKIIPFDPNILRYFAVLVISFLGLVLIIPQLSSYLESLVSRISGRFLINKNNSTGFWSGFFTGITLGIVWTPCAGPILATIATLAATQTVNIGIILVTTAYVIGVGIPLFIFAIVGRTLFIKSKIVSSYTGRIQQIFGVIMILTALSIATNYDKVIQTKLLNAFPQFSKTLTDFESNSLVTQQLDALKGTSSHTIENTSELLNENTPAPNFVGITHWLNIPAGQPNPTIKNLKGKVVLVDFWTYTCINCLRTLPYVTNWYDKYKDKGFVVIGIHTPEFEFEKTTTNVEQAITQYGIHYPVGQDNNYATWNNYSNQYWPAEYLIDSNGLIRRVHFGEGEYDQMEQAIQLLLKDAGQKNVSMPLATISDQTPREDISPETYIGANRAQYYYPSGTLTLGQQSYNPTNTIPLNSFSLGGVWTINGENGVTGKDATLIYHFIGNKVFLVLRPGTANAAQIKVFIDDKVATPQNGGVDVHNGIVTVDTDRLYNLVDLKGNAGEHTLRLEFETPGTEVFAFTFG